MTFKRSSGVILHPTCLPGPNGIGDLGPEAYLWVQFLADSGIGLWQILPLGPTGYGDSPYQCFSAFAGNPYLISPALLMDDGLLTATDLADRPVFPKERVDFGPVINWKKEILHRAYLHFDSGLEKLLAAEFTTFKAENAMWLEDFSLFMAIKDSQSGVSWMDWQPALRSRTPEALKTFADEHQQEIEEYKFFQFLFYKQWKNLRKFANSKSIKIIGDIPIFISMDSADAWSHPELFTLSSLGKPTAVAGVPPDYFSPTGQLWGNPLYQWSVHKQTGYAWWIDRVRMCLGQVDYIRLDHFRGFVNYWEVPTDKLTAEIGSWKPGPGSDLFHALRQALGDLPIIAEDLGIITPDVFQLRDQLGLPGMKVMQFAFANDATDAFLPHNYPLNCAAYTGTHDNDTSLGWFQTASDQDKKYALEYLNTDEAGIVWQLIRSIWSSVAVFAIAPMQDFLELGAEARFNFPGKQSGNWGWRMREEDLDPNLMLKIKQLNRIFGRLAG